MRGPSAGFQIPKAGQIEIEQNQILSAVRYGCKCAFTVSDPLHLVSSLNKDFADAVAQQIVVFTKSSFVIHPVTGLQS